MDFLRKYFLIILLFSSWAISQADETTSSTDSCARFKVLGGQLYDFGDIGQNDGLVTCTFLIHSVGQASLIIAKSATTCPCTQVSYPQDTLLPGDTLTVSVTYDPHLHPGPFSQAAVLRTNAKPYPFIRLNVIGNIIAAPNTQEDTTEELSKEVINDN